jgi:hypothetical protein
LLAIAIVPRLAVVCLPRPMAPHPNPLNAFSSSLSFSQAKPESKPWPESRLRDFPMSRHRPPLQDLAAGV